MIEPQETRPAAHDAEARERPRPATVLARIGIGLFAVTMTLFWTWAMFFADPEPVNRIGDTNWAQRAERRCAATQNELQGLANFSTLAPGNTKQIIERAAIVEQATDTLTTMLDDITATPPTDAKGQALIPQWTDEYRTYLNDRVLYVEKLRSQGRNLAFEETMTEDGVPASERLSTFAADNRMPSCAPPHDLR